jgi:glutamyl-tRNA synthetase
MPSLKDRATNIVLLAESALFYCRELPLVLNEKASKLINNKTIYNVESLGDILNNLDIWEIDQLEAATKEFANSKAIKLGEIAQPLRAALTGSTVSPGIFDVMYALGRNETLSRLKAFGNTQTN